MNKEYLPRFIDQRDPTFSQLIEQTRVAYPLHKDRIYPQEDVRLSRLVERRAKYVGGLVIDGLKNFSHEMGFDDLFSEQRSRDELESYEYIASTEQLVGEGVCLPEKRRIAIQFPREGELIKDQIEAFDNLMMHEMVHANSGKRFVKRRWDIKGHDEYSDGEILDDTKCGLGFKQVVGYRSRRPHRHGFGSYFRWLNEAMTENIALKIGKKEHPRGYVSQRKLAEKLRTSGKIKIPEEQFYRAYFENADESKKSEIRLPEWQKLFSYFNQSYYRDFLLDVDEAIIRKKGLIRILETDNLLDDVPAIAREPLFTEEELLHGIKER